MDLAPKLSDALSQAVTQAAASLGVEGTAATLDPSWTAPAGARVLVGTLPHPAEGEIALIVSGVDSIDGDLLSDALSACINEICSTLGVSASSEPFSSNAPAAFSITSAVQTTSATIALAIALRTGSSASAKGRTTDAMKRLHDVEMVVTAELGRARLSVREVLSMVPGNVVELDRVAGAPIDLLVNGKLVARGEVVVIDEEFGVRVTEVVGNED
jgi:flagellar motor switch protein FliN